MSDDFIEVWVELAISSGDNAASRPGAVKAVEGTHFRFGRTLKDAYMAADLMRKAQQSRKAAEDAINKSVGKHKRWGTNGALQKLKAFGGGKPSSMNMGERISVFVTLEDGTEIQVALQQVFPANKKQLIQTTTDLTGLTYMEEPNVLRSLKERYESGSIYTNIANIVVALNPYQVLNIYSAEYMMKYRDVRFPVARAAWLCYAEYRAGGTQTRRSSHLLSGRRSLFSSEPTIQPAPAGSARQSKRHHLRRKRQRQDRIGEVSDEVSSQPQSQSSRRGQPGRASTRRRAVGFVVTPFRFLTLMDNASPGKFLRPITSWSRSVMRIRC